MSGKRDKKQWLGIRIFQKSLKEIKTGGQNAEKENGACAKDERKSDHVDDCGISKKETGRATVLSLKQLSPKKRPGHGRGYRNGGRLKQIGNGSVKGSVSVLKGNLSSSRVGQDVRNYDGAQNKNLTNSPTDEKTVTSSNLKVSHDMNDRSFEEDWSKEIIDISVKENDTFVLEKVIETCDDKQTKIETERIESECCETPEDVKQFFKQCSENIEADSTHDGPLQSTPIKKLNKDLDKTCENRVVSDSQKLGMENSCILDINNVMKQELEQNTCLPKDSVRKPVIAKVQQDINPSIKSDNKNNNECHQEDDEHTITLCKEQDIEHSNKTSRHNNDEDHNNKHEIKSFGQVYMKNRGGFRGHRSQTTKFQTQSFQPSNWVPNKISRQENPRRDLRSGFRDTHHTRVVPPRFRNAKRGGLRSYDEPIKNITPLLEINVKKTKKSEPVWVLPSSEDWGSELDKEEIHVLDKEDVLYGISQESLYQDEFKQELKCTSEKTAQEIVVNVVNEEAIDHENLKQSIDMTKGCYLPPPPPLSDDELNTTYEEELKVVDPLSCKSEIQPKPGEKLKDLSNDSDSQQFSDNGLYCCNPDLTEIGISDYELVSQDNTQPEFCYEHSQDQEVPTLPKTHSNNRNRVSQNESQHESISGNSQTDLSDLYRSANHCFPWHHQYYMGNPYTHWYSQEMQYYDWLDYQKRCFGLVCPDDWERAEQLRQHKYQWQSTEFPHPFTHAEELERQNKVYQEQRISEFWQDRMPHWVKCQEATVQTSPSLTHKNDKADMPVRNSQPNKKRSPNMTNEHPLNKDLNVSKESTIPTQDNDIAKVTYGDISRDGIEKETVKNCKNETNRCRTESTTSTSCDKGGSPSECKCKADEVKYLVWRMCNCAVGNPPKLQTILHHGLEEISQDLGYHSVDSVDESGFLSHHYNKFVPPVPHLTPALKKKIGQLEKSMSDLGLAPKLSLSKKLNLNDLRPPPGYEPTVYPLMRGGRFSGPPERLVNSNSSMMNERSSNREDCGEPLDTMDSDLCNNNAPQAVKSNKSDLSDNVGKDINNNVSNSSELDNKTTTTVGGSQERSMLHQSKTNRDDMSSRDSLKSHPSQENSYMNLPSSLTNVGSDLPSSRTNMSEADYCRKGSVLSAFNTYNNAILAIQKTLNAGQIAGDIPTPCGNTESTCGLNRDGNLNDFKRDTKEQLGYPILQSKILECDQKVHSDSRPKSAGEEEDSSMCDADNESDASLDRGVVQLAVTTGQNNKTPANTQPHGSQTMLATLTSSNHQQQNRHYPHFLETRQQIMPSFLRPRSHFLRDSPIPRFNYSREEFPFPSPIPWTVGKQKAPNSTLQPSHIPQERPDFRGSGYTSSDFSPDGMQTRPQFNKGEFKPRDQTSMQRLSEHRKYGESFPLIHEPTTVSSETIKKVKSKHFPKLVDYGFTEDSSNDSEDQEQNDKKRENKGEKETNSALNMNMLPSDKVNSFDMLSEKSNVNLEQDSDTCKDSNNSDQTPSYLMYRRPRPKQKTLKSYTAPDHPYLPAKKPYSPRTFVNKKRSIEEILNDEMTRKELCSKDKEVDSTSRSPMSSPFSTGEAQQPATSQSQSSGSPFWGMYMPNSSSALTGNKQSPPKSYSAVVNAGLSSPAQRVFNNKQIRRSWPMLPSFTAAHSETDTYKITPYLSDWKSEFKSVHNFGVRYIDTHCHLDLIFSRENFSGNLADYMEKHPETFPEQFEGCVAVFCYPSSFNPNSGLWLDVAKESNVWIAMGCHPKMATSFTQEAEMGLRKCLRHSKIVALGEIGLDYSGNFWQNEAEQKRVFRTQIEIALAMDKPLVIHCRQAEDDCLEILKKMVPRDHKIHCHCFTLGYSNARRWLDAFDNLFIGITPLVTYTSATPSHDLARKIPLTKLLLETDAPYFIPRCIPKNDMPLSNPGLAVTVAREVAKYQEVTVSSVMRHCRLNTKYMYGI